MLRSDLLNDIPGILHGFSLRGGTIETVAADPRLADCRHALTDQIHGAVVHRLDEAMPGVLLAGDAFVASRSHTICHVRTADCVPILIAHCEGKAVAAVHAGWRGTVAGVAAAALRELASAYGIAAKDCVAAIGPRICGTCYEVGSEVVRGLAALGIGDAWRGGERHVDLGLANAVLLESAGILREKIELLPACTFCDDRFTSYRRDRSEAGRQVNWIVIRS